MRKQIKYDIPNFGPENYDKDCIYIFKSSVDGCLYKLHQIVDTKFAWLDLTNSTCWANGSFSSATKALQSMLSQDVYEFANLQDFVEHINELIGE